MVTIDSHGHRMGDAHEAERVGDMFKRRGVHIEALRPIEDMIHELAPLPASYDVSRMQPRFFTEFVYTPMMGCMLICPQSSELAARVVQFALENEEQGTFDMSVLARPRDKYNLDEPTQEAVERVVFLPGSNLFRDMLCRESLTRVMNDHPDAVMKPHPLTNQETIRHLGRLFGYDRILDPKASGTFYLENCEHAYVTSCTEMGLYAALMGKTVHNVGHVRHEARGAFHPFYRLIWKALTNAERTGTLLAALGAFGSGFIHPEDPQARDKLDRFFGHALVLREVHRDFVMEYDPPEYAMMTIGERKPDAIRKGEERPEQRGAAVPDDSARGARRFACVPAKV